MMQKFEFEKVRDFGNIIGDSFQFVVKNFRQLLIGFGIYVVPLMLLGGIFMAKWGSAFMTMMFNPLAAGDMDFSSIMSGVGGIYLSVGLASVVLYAFVFGYIHLYLKMEEQPTAIDVWGVLPAFTLRMLVYVVVVAIALIAPVALLAGLISTLPGGFASGGLIGILLLILIPVYFYVLVPLSIAPYIYLHEGLGLVPAVRRAFYIVRGHWWMTFAIWLVLMIIASIISYIFAIPAYIAMFATIFGAATVESSASGAGVWTSVLFMLSLLGSLLASMYYLVGFVLQYYNLREQKEGTRLMERIESLGQDDLV